MPPENTTPQKRKPIGPTVGIIVVIIVLLFGAFYISNKLFNNSSGTNNKATLEESVKEPDPIDQIPTDLSENATVTK